MKFTEPSPMDAISLENVARKLAGTGSADAGRAVKRPTASLDAQAQPAPEPAEFSPLMASVWADTILAYWRAAYAAGRLDPAQPLDVLDLMPGTGASVWLMLQALQRRLSSLPEFTGVLRYLAVGAKRDMLTALRAQPELQSDIAAGILVPVLWDPERGDPCLLTPGKRIPWRPANPAAVLAHDRWASLAQRFCAVHYGKLLEADIERLAHCAQAEQEATLWRPVQQDRMPDALRQLVHAYLSKFNSAPIPLPTGAMSMMERIAFIAQAGYLVLAAAPGLVSEHQIRLNHFSAVLSHYRRCAAMPVNFYLLDQYCARLAAASWQSALRPDLAGQAIVGNLPDPAKYLAVAVRVLESGGACDAPSLVTAARTIALARSSPKLDMLLALLRRSEYDPEVFCAGAAAITEALRTQPPADWHAWVLALERVWSCHLPAQQEAPLHRSLAPAAMRLGAWGLARRALVRGMQVHGERALDLAHLAWCEMRTGRARQAQVLAQRAVMLEKDDATALEVANRIGEKVAAWTGGWQASLASDVLPLSLEPMDASHAEALWRQYRDPQIAVMTGLPPLPTLEATREWIAEHLADQSRRSYAVMHADHGLVGYVCLAVNDHEAYFCFWIGADFQGSGFSVEAARLICKLGCRQGITHIFTSAYQDNARSLSALERSGFVRLGIRALPPENDRIFLFMNTGDVPVADPSANLAAYYEREKLPLYFSGQEQRQQADREAAGRHEGDVARHAINDTDLNKPDGGGICP
jgi:RimJ/RimL family protein N-acetyltransferase